MKKKLMIITIALSCTTTPIFAQETNPNTDIDTDQQAISYKWEKKKDHYLLKASDGSLLKGLTTIKNKTYDFDNKGIQHTGWQKIEGHYYYFTIANKEKGNMIKNKTINAIHLDKNDQAVVNGYAKKKLKALTYATKLVEQASVPTQSKNKQLRQCFDYFLKHIAYRGSPKFTHSKTWDIDYANATFSNKHSSCYGLGAAFAYVGNAVGYESYAISSGGHGWCMIDHKITDPSWHLIDRKHSYYSININLSGKAGRPNYKKGARFVSKI